MKAAQKIIVTEGLIDQICKLLEDVDNLRRKDATNPIVRDFDLDGVIEGCVGSLHVCRNCFDRKLFEVTFFSTQEISLQKGCISETVSLLL